MARMTEDDVKALVSSEISSSVGYLGSAVSKARAENLKYYMAEPFGNEVDGRSQIVTSDAMDTVEWIMPELMRIFAGSDDPVECTPEGPEDVEYAKQATDYCNHVWTKDNDGFVNLYSFIKDGLIERVGVVKIYWEEEESWERERYEGLTEEEFDFILSDTDVEIVEHTPYRQSEPVEGPAGMPFYPPLHDVVVKTKSTKGKVEVEPIPSDEFLISADGRNVQKARLVGHRTYKTRSELIAEGHPRKLVDNLQTDFGDTATEESVVRNEDDDLGSPTNNRAMEEVEVVECYIRMDYDGDGIAEMRKVVVAGADNMVLSNEPWEGSRPFAAWTPIIIPHRFFGLCPVDLVKDLQLLRSTIWRQYLDGLYNSVTPTYEVDTKRVTDPDEVLNRKTGSIIRKEGPEPVLTQVPTGFNGEAALRGIDEVDRMRENRTGVSERTQGLGADTLHDTMGGQDKLMTAAQRRVELIARVLAETGFKDAFKIILELSQRYQDKKRMVKIRNQWVPVDPRKWRSNYDIEVNVGLGNGTQDQRAMAARSILDLQMQALKMQGGAEGPLVTLENIYRTSKEVVKGAGFKDVDAFVSDPSGFPKKPENDVPPEVMEAQQKLELEAKIAEAKTSQDYLLKKAKMEAELELKQMQFAAEMEMAEKRLAMEFQLAQQREAANAAQGGMGGRGVQFGGEMG